MRKLRSIMLLLGAASIGALLQFTAAAQKPPPPKAIAPLMDRSRPHLLHDRLDHSFCNYPLKALRARIEGCCRMKVQIMPNGTAGMMTGQCTDPVFLDPSRTCLSPQAYLPAMKRGKAVESTGNIVVEFNLEAGVSNPVKNLFDKLLDRKPKPEPDDICKPRPDDLVAGLERLRGG